MRHIHRSSNGRLPALFATLAAVLVLGACGAPGGQQAQPGQTGGDDGGGGTPAEETGGDGAPQSDDVIHIGLLAPTTGTVAASGEDMVNGWNLFWEQQGGEIAGVPVQTSHEDSAGDPAVALNKAELLVGNGVDFIVGPLLANSGLAVSEAMNRENVPVFHPVVSADNLTQREQLPGTIRVAGWTSSQTTHPFGQWAYDQGYRRMVTLCTDYAFGHENCGGFVNTFTDAGGEIVDQLWQPIGTEDFSTYITQIQAADPDAVFVTTVGAASVRVVEAWSDFGLKGEIPFLGNETTLDQSLLRSMDPAAAEGLISTGHYAEGRDVAATQDFVDAYQEAYDEIPSYYAVSMYTAAQWVAGALEEVGGDLSDQEAFLEVVKNVELDESPMGPMALDDFKNPIENVYIREVQAREDGALWNVPIETYEEVDQYWTYEPQVFLDHPVYSRDYQGAGVWPEPNPNE